MKRIFINSSFVIVISLLSLWLYSEFYSFDRQEHNPITLIAKERNNINNTSDNTIRNISKNIVPDESLQINKTTYKKQEKIQEFYPPNTYWTQKALLINGVLQHYAFGNGNPSSLQLSDDELVKIRENTKEEPGFGYVTPSLENELLALILNPGWRIIFIKCNSNIQGIAIDAPTILESISLREGLDLETLLYIDASGRKALRIENLMRILQFLQHLVSYEDENIWKNCLSEIEYQYHLLGLLAQCRKVLNMYFGVVLEN